MQEFIEIDNQNFFVERIGRSENPPILLIAGAGAHARFWTDSFCDPFLKEYSLIRYDHRDVGLSDSSPSDYDLNRLVKDAIDILNSFYISKAYVIGHSMGGYIGQILASDYPERLLGLTLISAGPAGMTPSLKRVPTNEEKMTLYETWRVMLQNRPKDTFEESWEGYERVWSKLNGKIPLDQSMAKTYTEDFFIRTKHKVGSVQKHVKAMQKMAETLEERKEIFSKIDLPTLIIQGKEDYLVLPEKGGKALLEVLPHAQLEMVLKMGHMLFDKDLEQKISEKILSFLEKTK